MPRQIIINVEALKSVTFMADGSGHVDRIDIQYTVKGEGFMEPKSRKYSDSDLTDTQQRRLDSIMQRLFNLVKADEGV